MATSNTNPLSNDTGLVSGIVYDEDGNIISSSFTNNEAMLQANWNLSGLPTIPEGTSFPSGTSPAVTEGVNGKKVSWYKENLSTLTHDGVVLTPGPNDNVNLHKGKLATGEKQFVGEAGKVSITRPQAFGFKYELIKDAQYAILLKPAAHIDLNKKGVVIGTIHALGWDLTGLDITFENTVFELDGNTLKARDDVLITRDLLPAIIAANGFDTGKSGPIKAKVKLNDNAGRYAEIPPDISFYVPTRNVIDVDPTKYVPGNALYGTNWGYGLIEIDEPDPTDVIVSEYTPIKTNVALGKLGRICKLSVAGTGQGKCSIVKGWYPVDGTRVVFAGAYIERFDFDYYVDEENYLRFDKDTLAYISDNRRRVAGFGNPVLHLELKVTNEQGKVLKKTIYLDIEENTVKPVEPTTLALDNYTLKESVVAQRVGKITYTATGDRHYVFICRTPGFTVKDGSLYSTKATPYTLPHDPIEVTLECREKRYDTRYVDNTDDSLLFTETVSLTVVPYDVVRYIKPNRISVATSHILYSPDGGGYVPIAGDINGNFNIGDQSSVSNFKLRIPTLVRDTGIDNKTVMITFGSDHQATWEDVVATGVISTSEEVGTKTVSGSWGSITCPTVRPGDDLIFTVTMVGQNASNSLRFKLEAGTATLGVDTAPILLEGPVTYTGDIQPQNRDDMLNAVGGSDRTVNPFRLVGILSANGENAAPYTWEIEDPLYEITDDLLVKLKDSSYGVNYEETPTIDLVVTATDRYGYKLTETITVAVINRGTDEWSPMTGVKSEFGRTAGNAIDIYENQPGAHVCRIYTVGGQFHKKLTPGVDDERFEVISIPARDVTTLNDAPKPYGTSVFLLKLKDGYYLDFETEKTGKLTVSLTEEGEDTKTCEVFFKVHNDITDDPGYRKATSITLSHNTVSEEAEGHDGTNVIGKLLNNGKGNGDNGASDSGGVYGIYKPGTASNVYLGIPGSKVDKYNALFYISDEYGTPQTNGNIVGQYLCVKTSHVFDAEIMPEITIPVYNIDTAGAITYDNVVVTVLDDPTNNYFKGSGITLTNNTLQENYTGIEVGRLDIPDGRRLGYVRYTVDDDRFEVSEYTLKLKDGVLVDWEDEPTINLVITSTDRRGGQHTLSTVITVENNDYDNPGGSVYTQVTDILLSNNTVPENVDGAFIGRLSNNGFAVEPLSYTVDDARFEVVDTNRLKLKNDVSLEYETVPFVNVNITSTDVQNNTFTKEFKIIVIDSVTDTYEAVSDFDIDGVPGVREGVDGAAVGTIFTVVPNGNKNAPFSYRLSDPRFSANNDGEITLKPGVTLNYAIEQSISVEITVQDSHGATFAKPVEIAVLTEVLDNYVPATNMLLDDNTVIEGVDGAEVGNLSLIGGQNYGSVTFTTTSMDYEIVGNKLKLKDGITKSNDLYPSEFVTVRSEDGHGGTKVKGFIITIVDAADAAYQPGTTVSITSNNSNGG